MLELGILRRAVVVAQQLHGDNGQGEGGHGEDDMPQAPDIAVEKNILPIIAAPKKPRAM